MEDEQRMRVSREIREFLSSIGTKGGSSTSPAKVKAVRENGRRGGRPKGTTKKIRQAAGQKVSA